MSNRSELLPPTVTHTFVWESLDREPPREPAPSEPASSSLARGQPLQARQTPLGLWHQEGTPGHPSSRPRQRDLLPRDWRVQMLPRCTRVRRSCPARSVWRGAPRPPPWRPPGVTSQGSGLASRRWADPRPAPLCEAACGPHAVHRGPVRREKEEKTRAQEVCAWQRWGVGGQRRPGNLVGGAEGVLVFPRPSTRLSAGLRSRVSTREG